MAEYTTFKTGGPADLLIQTDNRDSIQRIINATGEYRVPLTVIGGGSNLLISDRGIRGIVLRIAGSDSSPVMTDDGIVYCGAAAAKSEFMNWCAEGGFGGIEFIAGIPGSIGGGIFMNAGTNLGWFADILDSVELALPNSEIKRVSIESAGAGYRKTSFPEGGVITGGYFKLERGADAAAVKKKIDSLIDERNQKHPVNIPSAGSVFKNPEGYSSWKLIRDCGFSGKRIGGAEVSALHTNFIVNAAGASSLDIKNLINEIVSTVSNRFGVILETEIKMIGDF